MKFEDANRQPKKLTRGCPRLRSSREEEQEIGDPALPRVGRSAFNRYDSRCRIIQDHVPPRWRKLRLDEIKQPDVTAWLTDKMAEVT